MIQSRPEKRNLACDNLPREEFVVRLTSLRFYSRIGYFEQERIVGNEFSVDVEISLKADNFQNEELASTISYAEVYSLVKEIMGREWLLLESAAMQIGKSILALPLDFQKVGVRISKLAPPIESFSGNASVEYRWEA